MNKFCLPIVILSTLSCACMGSMPQLRKTTKPTGALLAVLDRRPYMSGERDAPEKLHQVVALLKKGADVNATTTDGYTPLLLAIEDKRYDTTLLLIARGAKVDVRTRRGVTPMMLAANFGYDKIIRRLLERKAPIDALDNEGQTALMEAAMNGRIEAVQTLLEHGAEADLINNFGYSALQYAHEADQPAIEKLLHRRTLLEAANSASEPAVLQGLSHIGAHPVTVESELKNIPENAFLVISTDGSQRAWQGESESSGPGAPWGVNVRSVAKNDAFGTDTTIALRLHGENSVVREADTSRPIQLAHPVPQCWSADNRNLLLTNIPFYSTDDYSLWRLDVAAHTAERLTPPDIFCNDPVFSPDGTAIAFAGARARKKDASKFADVVYGDWHIYTVSSKGGSLKDLGLGQYPHWSPGGHKLAFLIRHEAGDDNLYDLYTMHSSGTGRERILSSSRVARTLQHLEGRLKPNLGWIDDETLIVSATEGNGVAASTDILWIVRQNGSIVQTISSVDLISASPVQHSMIVRCDERFWRLSWKP